ncbi:MAG: hypothetical protein HY900_35180 [Deltaproteobacteria bacterium]|nr:hypothetical protein [Deltaproteobacteria bacterium]
MRSCDRCGAALKEREPPADPLAPLQEAGRVLQGLPETASLCSKCREEQRLLGIAALFGKNHGG